MHQEQIGRYQHQHAFNINKKHIEKRTFVVTIITFTAMFFEIFYGWKTNSMALFADGWHMGTHAFALGISLLAYIFARKYIKDRRFTFGTWKIEILGAYTSAIVLGMVGMIMIYSSVERLIHPLNINYYQALFVAIIGLIVNLICALILNINNHSHSHENHNHATHAHDDDLNFKSAYLHVIADAMTSVFAIAALFGARYFNLYWLDPFMGIAGAVLIIRWTFLLLKNTSSVLLDRETNSGLSKEIQEHIEFDGDTKISDLHLWKVADNKYACIISLIVSKNRSIDEYRKRLMNVHELAHVTIEINKIIN